MSDVRHEIDGRLTGIECEYSVRVLFSVESGSRAWGFASPNSDYDVRFVYVHPLDHYLRLDKQRDVIEQMSTNHVFDLSGWDLPKLLALLHSSNPTIFEWDASPICYRTTEFWKTIRKLLPAYFSPKKAAFHYLNTATSNEKAYLRADQVKLKKYFYALRPLLACRWVLERGTPPPMPFVDLADALFPPTLRPVLNDLLTVKTQAYELGLGKRIPELDSYIQEALAELSDQADALPINATPGWEPLNGLFRATVS
ncbi:MAG: nucleotidyltransferase domain-containing protein [Propionibacteriaceae bacterium]|jgi:predicted nucleotidyltransferase|nr:nucleotidyltransferase domain-containing protein [Propionibacteriaceae bacterium]